MSRLHEFDPFERNVDAAENGTETSEENSAEQHDLSDNRSADQEIYGQSAEQAEQTKNDVFENGDTNTASTVYTPKPSEIFTYPDANRLPVEEGRQNVRKSGVAMTAILLSLCLILGMVGGAAGMMAVLSRNAESDAETTAPNGGESVSAGDVTEEAEKTTLYRDSSVFVVETSVEGSEMNVAQVYAQVADSVVAITTSVQMKSNYYGGFYVTTGSGSGVIISEEGYIVTNYHVIDGAEEITVMLANGNSYSAVCIDGDKAMDIAVLKIEPQETLAPAVIGASGGLAVGQEIVAVGNPLGILPGSVTDGIVSALNRTLEIDGYTRTLIQTNAAINPGNSGGGLFDRYGRLIGIVNAKQSSEGVEGLGFAIPIDLVFASIVEIIDYGYIRGRACLNLEYTEITSVSEAYYYYGNQSTGVYIQSSNYSGADIAAGDRIVTVNGIEISAESDLYSVLSTLTPGDEVTLTLGRIMVVTSGRFTSYKEVTHEVTVKLKEYLPSSITFR